MTLNKSAALLLLLCSQWCSQVLYSQVASESWTPDMSAGKAAFSAGKYDLAAGKYLDAWIKAEEGGAGGPALLPILRAFATALRTNADPAGAQQVIERVLAMVADTHGASSVEVATLLSDLAVVQRAQDLRKEATETLMKAIAIRMRTPPNEYAAKDATLLASIFREMGENDRAMPIYRMALSMWAALSESGLQILTALDPLASLHREKLDYLEAEKLYTWALRLREAAIGPKDSELISTVDSLSYVLFGLKKFSEAEAMYNRLLALWEMVGGPDHPMVALTLDKMAEFYIEQKRYEAAEPIALRSLAIRSKATLETMHRTGRVLAGERKMDEAADVYSRALHVAADARVPDEAIPGTLRAYALLLRQNQRGKDAEEIEKRLKEALDRKADKEGRRPAPAPVNAN